MSDSMGQPHVAVTQMNQMTQQSVELVKKIAAVAASLNDQAQRLAQVMQVFRTDETGAAKAMPSVPSGSVNKASADPCGAYKAGEQIPSNAAVKPNVWAVIAPSPVAQPAARMRLQSVATPASPPSAKASNAASTEGEWESF